MGIHDVAARGFDAGADVYERARPSYPPEAVAWLVDHLHLRPGVTVLDLAAGTGKLTRLLASTGVTLLAVEPVEGMRTQLRATQPAVPVAAATAEALPFPGAVLDAVTVAQAFHWFDTDRAFTELARVLRPGGRVGMIWNARDRQVDWVDQLWSIMDRVEKRAPWRDHEQWSHAALGARPGFGPLHEATFHHEQPITPDGIVERFASVSHVAVLPDADRAVVLDEIRTALATHPETAGRDDLALPYRVDAYWCERT
ncbi:MAG TPA: class I SAM-dependent methyltransferase [Acidimicrobiia bacterium]|nr:class I SAM-dependent methyltransferase [Acidimicrobiia bacterium]